MEDILIPIIVIPTIFIGLPWLVLHYITRWKTSPTLTDDDEELLDDLHRLARKLEDRLETVERLVAIDNPDFQPEFRPSAKAGTARGRGQLADDPLTDNFFKGTEQ